MSPGALLEVGVGWRGNRTLDGGTSEKGLQRVFALFADALLYNATLTFNSSGNWSLKSTFFLMLGDQEEMRRSLLRGAFM